MRSWLRWTVTAVLTLDALAALAFLGSEVLETRAATNTPALSATQAQPVPAQPAHAAPTGVAGTIPAATASAPDASATAQVQAADTAAAPPDPAVDAEAHQADTIPGAGEDEPQAPLAFVSPGAAKSDAFIRLLRAYENMEPESAAKALSELAARDRRAVVELVLHSKPRTSGAMLDALTVAHPALAADLSYEIWRRAESEARSSAKPESAKSTR